MSRNSRILLQKLPEKNIQDENSETRNDSFYVPSDERIERISILKTKYDFSCEQQKKNPFKKIQTPSNFPKKKFVLIQEELSEASISNFDRFFEDQSQNDEEFLSNYNQKYIRVILQSGQEIFSYREKIKNGLYEESVSPNFVKFNLFHKVEKKGKFKNGRRFVDKKE